MTTTYTLTDHEQVTVHSHTPEALVVEAVYRPGGRKPVLHLHPEQDEHFEVLEGTVSARIGDEVRELGAGERFAVPRGTPHSMANGGASDARVLWRTEPALDTLGWWEALDAAHAAGRTGPVDLAPALLAHQREFQLAGPGMGLATRGLALAARAKGALSR